MMVIIIKFKYDTDHENGSASWRAFTMKVGREQMAQNRSRILTEAARLFREKGFDAVSVSEVMKAAGMTHGGFYGHFRSKDDLITHAIAHEDSNRSATGDIDAWINGYLSTRHRDHPGRGCLIAALAGLMGQQCPEARASMARALAAQIDSLSASEPGADVAVRRRAAIGNWSAMVGALILARSIENTALSDEVLSETRAWIDEKQPLETQDSKQKGNAA